MGKYEAVLFDLDDTLLDRDKAVDVMFSIILERCYKNIEEVQEDNMLQKLKMLFSFKQYDNRGYSNKTRVLNDFFDEYPPTFRIPNSEIIDFWNTNFPNCFSLDSSIKDVIKKVRSHVKTAIVTNGGTQVQKAKIMKTNLDLFFEVIIVSDEVGIAKPDPGIFELALNRLDVSPESTLFVGDNLEKDIGGCQSAKIKGIWYNPNNRKNCTTVKPFAEINNLQEILTYIE